MELNFHIEWTMRPINYICLGSTALRSVVCAQLAASGEETERFSMVGKASW